MGDITKGRGCLTGKEQFMVSVSIKDLLDAGVHFGHQTARWNPKMKQFIFGERNGIYIIDLQQTHQQFQKALEFVDNITSNGEKVLFVGTKKQAQEIVEEEARKCSMFFVTNRWLGGTLTNFKTIRTSIEKLLELERIGQSEIAKQRTKKELSIMEKDRVKLERALGGIKMMRKLPGAIFVIDPKKEKIAIAEAAKLGIPIIAVTDTNCDPDGIDYVIPGNDDAIKSIKLFAGILREACVEGQLKHQEKLKEDQKRAEDAGAGAGSRGEPRERKIARDKAQGKVIIKPKRRKEKPEDGHTGEGADHSDPTEDAQGASADPDGTFTIQK
jgi:small subunit ribosomal protein S2